MLTREAENRINNLKRSIVQKISNNHKVYVTITYIPYKHIGDPKRFYPKRYEIDVEEFDKIMSELEGFDEKIYQVEVRLYTYNKGSDAKYFERDNFKFHQPDVNDTEPLGYIDQEQEPAKYVNVQEIVDKAIEKERERTQRQLEEERRLREIEELERLLREQTDINEDLLKKLENRNEEYSALLKQLKEFEEQEEEQIKTIKRMETMGLSGFKDVDYAQIAVPIILQVLGNLTTLYASGNIQTVLKTAGLFGTKNINNNNQKQEKVQTSEFKEE